MPSCNVRFVSNSAQVIGNTSIICKETETLRFAGMCLRNLRIAQRRAVTYAYVSTHSLIRRGAGLKAVVKRLIASSLLVIFLAGMFAPAAMALSQDPPHACCLRKTSHCHGEVQAEPALSSGGCAQHSCCRSLTVRQWAQAALPLALASRQATEHTALSFEIPLHRSEAAVSHAGRAPPTFLIV